MMILGYDLSNFSGQPDAAKLTALRNRFDLRRAILACQFPDTYTGWAQACDEASVPFEAYLYLYNSSDYVEQLEAAEAQLNEHPPRRLWLDFEDETTPLPDFGLISEVLAIAHARWPGTGIYTSEGYWRMLGNPTVGDRCPLWLARWTNSPPDEQSGFDAGFGGWVRAHAVQYAGEVLLEGINLDLNAWNEDDVP